MPDITVITTSPYVDPATTAPTIVLSAQGMPGIGVPPGGNATQVLAKNSGADYDTAWVNPGSGAGAVTSVFNRTGAVIAANNDYNLNQIGTPTANYNLGNTKLTNALAGSASSDVATFGQIPLPGTTVGTYAAGNDSRITGAIQSSIVTAKGDIIGSSGNGTPVRVPVGADGTFLVAASGQSSSVQWRDIVSADLPGTIGSNTTGNAATATLAANATAIDGVTVSGSPSIGWAILATSASAASWQALPAAPVTTVFGRTGAVAAANNDYSFSQISGTATIGQGGTGQITAAAAFNALSPLTALGDTLYGGTAGAGTRLAGNTTATKEFLTQTGTGSVSAAPAWGTIASGDLPATIAANTTGTASNVTGTVGIGNGGTGQISASAGFNALSPLTTLGDILYGGSAGAGSRLAGNTSSTKNFLIQTGTGSVSAAPSWGAIASSDLPATIAANTTGTSANVTGTVAVGNGGTGQITASAAYGALSPMTTLGDIEYQGSSVATRLAGNTTTTREFLSSTGTGSASAAPAWTALSAGDLPTYTYDAPAERGMLEWNMPLISPPTANAFTLGVVYGITFVAKTNGKPTKFAWHASSTAGTPTAGENLLGLYSVSGTTWTQIAVSGDLGSWGPASQINFANFSGSPNITLVPGATYAILAVSNGASAVALRGLPNTTPTWLNGNCSNTGAPWYKFFNMFTGQTTLPSSFTGSQMTVTGPLMPFLAIG